MKEEHHPPHLYFTDKIYFITCRVIRRKKYFNNNGKKKLLWQIFQEAKKKFNIKLFSYVILINHYHLLIGLPSGIPDLAGKDLPKGRSPVNTPGKTSANIGKVIGFINGKSSFGLNKLDKASGRQVWYQYWDRCIRNKKDFFIRFNYIHQNPVKHGETKDLYSYPFSSAKNYLEEYGKEWFNACLKDYPVVDFTNFGE